MGWRKWVGVVVSVLLSIGLFGALVQAEGALSPAAGSPGHRYYLELVGAKQGQIRSAGKDGLIPVMNFAHEVTTAREAGSGLATGRRQHQPLKIVKAIDRATPLLYNAMIMHENLTKVTLQLQEAGPTAGNKPATAYSIALTNARISSIVQKVEESTGVPYEEISFTYQSIDWTWHDGGVTAHDDWTTTR